MDFCSIGIAYPLLNATDNWGDVEPRSTTSLNRANLRQDTAQQTLLTVPKLGMTNSGKHGLGNFVYANGQVLLSLVLTQNLKLQQLTTDFTPNFPYTA